MASRHEINLPSKARSLIAPRFGVLSTISKKTPLAKAIKYALTRLPKARPYLDYGFLELDNNTAERAIRPITLGRKTICSWGLRLVAILLS